jgi:hypothetical protein
MKLMKDGKVYGLIFQFQEQDRNKYVIGNGKVVRVLKRKEEYGEDTDNPERIIIRNPGSCSVYNDLGVRVQGSNEDTPRHFYGYNLAYHECFEIEERRALEMYTVLRKVNNKMKKMYDKRGPYTSVAGFVSRVCEALGLKYIIFSKTNCGWSYDDNEHDILSIEDGIFRISKMETDWIGGKPIVESKMA